MDRSPRAYGPRPRAPPRGRQYSASGPRAPHRAGPAAASGEGPAGMEMSCRIIEQCRSRSQARFWTRSAASAGYAAARGSGAPVPRRCPREFTTTTRVVRTEPRLCAFTAARASRGPRRESPSTASNAGACARGPCGPCDATGLNALSQSTRRLPLPLLPLRDISGLDGSVLHQRMFPGTPGAAQRSVSTGTSPIGAGGPAATVPRGRRTTARPPYSSPPARPREPSVAARQLTPLLWTSPG